MTQRVKPRKVRKLFTIEQKLDYAKLMVNEGYTNKQIMEISGACSSAVTRWKNNIKRNSMVKCLIHLEQ